MGKEIHCALNTELPDFGMCQESEPKWGYTCSLRFECGSSTGSSRPRQCHFCYACPNHVAIHAGIGWIYSTWLGKPPLCPALHNGIPSIKAQVPVKSEPAIRALLARCGHMCQCRQSEARHIVRFHYHMRRKLNQKRCVARC